MIPVKGGSSAPSEGWAIYLKKMMNRFRKSLAFKLTLMYSLLFTLAFVIVFSAIYYMLGRALSQNSRRELLDDSVEIIEAYGKGNIEALKKYISNEMEGDGPANKFIRVLDLDGHTVLSSAADLWGSLPIPKNSDLDRRRPVVRTVKIPRRPGHQARAVAFFVGNYIVEEMIPIERDVRLLARLRNAFGLGLLLTFLVAVPSGWFMARRSSRQIRGIDRVARSIAAGADLSRRVPLKGTNDELDHLAKTFNLMVERLEHFLRELNDMMDNTAHDFNTPLSRIRAMAETGLGTTSGEEIQGTLVQIMDECDRFLSLLNAVMDISQARTGILPLKKEELSANSLLLGVVGLYSGVAEERGIRLNVTSPRDERAVLFADKKRLSQAVSNILDNALKYSSSGDTVAVWTRSESGLTEIGVADSGSGIPEEEIPRIFERFYRLDTSRSTSGRGIGLSLAKAYVEAHGGTITVKSQPGKGSTFCIRIPV
jgi:signal transduction histidine kinase